MKHPFLSLLIGLIVGGVVGFLVADLNRDATAAPPLPPVDPARFGAPARPEATDRPATGLDGVAPIRPAELTREAIEGRIERSELPALEEGTGSITGRVTTAKGSPLAGVLVRADHRGSPPTRQVAEAPRVRKGIARPFEAPLAERVDRWIETELWRQAQRRETRTDADGHFALTGLTWDAYGISAWAEGYEVVASGRSWNVKPGTKLDFRARKIIEVPVTVLLPDGSTAPKAGVEAVVATSMGGHEASTLTWTAADPTLQLSEGRWRLSGVIDAETRYRSDDVPVTLRTDTEVEPVVLQLAERNRIRVKVNVPAGDPTVQVVVFHARYSPKSPPDPAKLKDANDSQWLNAEQGFQWSLDDVAPGHYQFGVARNWGERILVSKSVEVVSGHHDLVLDLPAIDPAEFVVVRVFDPEGEILPNVTISYEYESGTSNGSGGGTCHPEDDGSIRFRPPDNTDNEESGVVVKHWITATHPEYGTKRAPFVPGQTLELNLHFVAPATLVVSVAGLAGSTLEGHLGLSLTRAGTDPSAGRHLSSDSKVDSRGEQRFGPIEPGGYEIVVWVCDPQDPHSHWAAGRHPVTVIPGENRAFVPLPVVHSLTVRAPEVEKGTGASLHGRGGVGQELWLHRELDAEGRVVFAALPPGSYELQLNSGDGPMFIELAGDLSVTFKPSTINALQVTIDDPKGYLATAGFQTGDEVVAINGKGFTDRMEMMLAFTSAGKGTATCTVARGAGTVTIDIEVRTLMKGRDLGGRLDPASR